MSDLETNKMASLRFRDFGDVLVTRDQGEPVRRHLLHLLTTCRRVEVNLDDVEAYTPSFMDEVLGKCLVEIGRDRFGSDVKLVATRVEVRKLVNLILSNRAAGKQP